MWNFNEFLDKIDSYWKKELLIKVKNQLGEEGLKKYKNKNLSLNQSSKNDIDIALRNLKDNNDLPMHSIENLYIECIENQKMKIKLFKIPNLILEQLNLKNIIETVSGDKDYLDKYTLSSKMENTSNSGENLTYINVLDNELRLVYRWTYIYTIKTLSGYKDERRVIPVCIIINNKTGFAQIRIRTATGVPYSMIWDEMTSILKNIFNVNDKGLSTYPLTDTINNLFHTELLIKFEGRHKVRQKILNNNSCNAIITIKIDECDKNKKNIDYVKLPIFNVIREQMSNGTIESIKGLWNTNLDATNIFFKQRYIHFDAVNNEIILKSDYMEKEVNYVLSKIQ